MPDFGASLCVSGLAVWSQLASCIPEGQVAFRAVPRALLGTWRGRCSPHPWPWVQAEACWGGHSWVASSGCTHTFQPVLSFMLKGQSLACLSLLISGAGFGLLWDRSDFLRPGFLDHHS